MAGLALAGAWSWVFCFRGGGLELVLLRRALTALVNTHRALPLRQRPTVSRPTHRTIQAQI